MAESFYSILTKVGAAKIANAFALGTHVNITQFAVGDGNGAYYNPTDTQAALVHEVWRGAVQALNVDPQNPNWLVVEVVIPTTDGGFFIREAGIFDDAGDLIAIGKYPETYKPLVSDGSAKDLYIKMVIQVSNAASVTLKVDPSVVLATKNDVNALAGAGRTTETVKGNADKIITLTTQELESTGYGVISGLTVTAQTAPNMTVNVATGIVHMASGIRLAPAGNSALAITAADATNPRIDIVYVKSDSTIGYAAGSAAATPTAPDTPTGAFLLAEIAVEANATSIIVGNITDKRKMKNTTDSNAAGINALAGFGRTTETVKGNANNIVALQQEVDEHKADTVKHITTDERTAWNAKLDASQKGVANGVAPLGPDLRVPLANLPTMVDPDNGRYQSEYGFNGTSYSDCILLNGDVTLSKEMSVSQAGYNTNGSLVYATDGVGQRLLAAFTQDMTSIQDFSIKVSTVQGTPTYTLQCTIYDETAGTVLGTATASAASAVVGNYITFIFPDGLLVTPGHILQIRVSPTVSSVSNYVLAGYTTGDATPNSEFINTANGWSAVNTQSTYDLAFIINYTVRTLSGTAVKALTQSDLKRWGNLKFTKTTPANTSVVCDICDSNDELASSVNDGISGLSVYAVQWRGMIFTALHDSNPTVQVTTKLSKQGAPATQLEVHIYTDSPGVPGASLGSATIDQSQITTAGVFQEITVDIALSTPLVKGAKYYVIYKTTGGDSINLYIILYSANGTPVVDSYYSNNSGGSWTSSTNHLWYKVIQDPTVLKGDVVSVVDLSDIDPTLYPALLVRWTLTRNAMTDDSPTVIDPSWTWEGNRVSDGGWEYGFSQVVPQDTSQVDITGLSEYRRVKIKISNLQNTSTTTNVSLYLRCNGDTTLNYSAKAYNHLSVTASGSDVIHSLNSYHVSAFTIEFDNVANLPKSFLALGGFGGSQTGSADWNNMTDLVNTLSFYLSANNIKAGAKFEVWGVR